MAQCKLARHMQMLRPDYGFMKAQPIHHALRIDPDKLFFLSPYTDFRKMHYIEMNHLMPIIYLDHL